MNRKDKNSKKTSTGQSEKAASRHDRLQLNPRQEMFAIELANGLTAADAYRIVYGQGNYSDDSLYTQASKMSAKVAPRVKELLQERAMNSEADRKRCNAVLMNIVNSNPKRTMYTDPKSGKVKMRTPQQLADDTADAISEMTNHNGRVVYRFHGKVDAIRVLAQINGWNAAEKKEVSVNGMEGVKIIDFGEFPDSLKDPEDDKM